MAPGFATPLPLGAVSTAPTRRAVCRRKRDATHTPRCCEKKKEGGDIIERVWTAIFGAKQAEPLGLKRFDRDRFPELYYGTLDEFADPVDSDDELAAAFRPLLARTQLQTRAVQLLYDANRDGWSALE